MEEIDGFLGIIVLVALLVAAAAVVVGSTLGFVGWRGFGEDDAFSAMFSSFSFSKLGFRVSSAWRC